MGNAIGHIYTTLVVFLIIIIISRLFQAFSLLGVYLKNRRIEKLVDIDRLLSARLEIPVTAIIVIKEFNEKVVKIIDEAIALKARKKEIILLFNSNINDRNELIKHYNFEERSYVIKRELTAPTEQSVMFSKLHPGVQLAIFNGELNYAELFNFGLNMSRYPYVLPLLTDYRLKPMILFALTRPIIASAQQVDLVSAPIYYSHESRSQRGFDIRTLYKFSLLKGAICHDSLKLFRREAIIEVGGFSSGGKKIFDVVAGEFMHPYYDNKNMITDTIATYSNDDKSSITSDIVSEVSYYIDLVKTENLVYSKLKIRLIGLLNILRFVFYPIIIAIVLLGVHYDIMGANLTLVSLLISDLLIEQVLYVIASLVADSAKEKVIDVVKSGIVSWAITPAKLLIYSIARKN